MNDHPKTVIIGTPTQLIDQYRTGIRDFSGANLKQSDLQGVNLKGADLSYADLSEANLQSASLRGVDLSYADMEQANLQNADLRGAILIGTNFRSVDLSQTHLRDADYDHTTHFPKAFDPTIAGLKLKAESGSST